GQGRPDQGRRPRRARHLRRPAGRPAGLRTTRPRGGRGPATPDMPSDADRDVLRLREVAFADAAALLAGHGLSLVAVADDAPIPGSYWGEPEAGIIGSNVYVRGDTPVHSMLHE